MERRKLEESKDPMMLVAIRSVKQPKGDSAGKWKIRQLVGEGDGDGDGQQGRLLTQSTQLGHLGTTYRHQYQYSA
jgi:hypothetical protein